MTYRIYYFCTARVYFHRNTEEISHQRVRFDIVLLAGYKKCPRVWLFHSLQVRNSSNSIHFSSKQAILSWKSREYSDLTQWLFRSLYSDFTVTQWLTKFFQNTRTVTVTPYLTVRYGYCTKHKPDCYSISDTAKINGAQVVRGARPSNVFTK